MCGIFAIFGLPEPGVNWRETGKQVRQTIFYTLKRFNSHKANNESGTMIHDVEGDRPI